MKRVIFGILLSVAATGALAKDAFISVRGMGVVSATPDIASITMGVVTQGETAKSAMAENAAIMASVLKTLTEAHVESKDIRTSDINLNPQWNHRQNDGKPPVITGYQATNNVNVRVLDIDNLGAILDQISQTGANNFHGIQFDLQDRKPVLDQARVEAVHDARAKAELYADAAGVRLGKILEISESTVNARPRNMRMAEAMSASAVPVSQGTMEITAQISIVFALAD